MKTIDNDIKNGQLKKAYLLYGQERYLIRQYRDKLVNAISSKVDTMNFSCYVGEDFIEREMIVVGGWFGFFWFLLEDTGLFKKNGDDLAEYLPTLSESTYFVFVEEEVDKRSKLFKAVSKAGEQR